MRLVPGVETEEKAQLIKQDAQSLVNQGLTTDKLVNPREVPAEAKAVVTPETGDNEKS